MRLLLAEALALALEAVPEGQPGEVAGDVESAMFTHYKASANPPTKPSLNIERS